MKENISEAVFPWVSMDIEDLDIEQLRKELYILRYVIWHAPGNIYWKDINGVYLGCSKRIFDIVHKTVGKSLIENKIHDFCDKSLADCIYQTDTKVIVNNKEVLLEESAFDINGAPTVYLTEKVPLHDISGTVTGLLGISIDITDRKKMEQALVDAKEQANAFNKLALQVAHDIRSPLMTISMLSEVSKTIPEEERILLREAVQRLHDIADGLLTQHRAQQRLGNETHIERILVSTAVLSVLSEKRLQYQGRGIEFNFICDSPNYFACIDSNRVHFKRMISNLLNNAVEASKNTSGVVTVAFKKDDKNSSIIIKDTGSGMTAEQVQRLMSDQVVASNKVAGHGLGLTHTKETLKKSQATLGIESQLNQGTVITLKFPSQEMAKYLEHEIRLQKSCIIVVLDDDPSIHGAWDCFFASIQEDYPFIHLQHFTDGQACVNYISSQNAQDIVLLTDYELIDQKLNGLDVVSKVNVDQAVLVTSHYEDVEIIARAISLNTKIIPKVLVPHVTFRVV